jgi:transposase-like protein
MSKPTRRIFSAEFKASVALEAIKEQKTISEFSHQFEVHPVTISKWKTEFLQNMGVVFEGEGRPGKGKDFKDLDKLYVQIGQLKVESDFLKKSARKLGIPNSEWK